MVTIKDLAKESCVSVATVSRVLNSSGYASRDVKRRVLEAAAKLDYKPNEVARALNTSRSNIVGVLVPDITNPYFPKVIRGIEDAAIRNNYRVIIGNTDHDAEKEMKYLEIFRQNNCAGIISATWSVSREHRADSRPLVLLDRVVENHISIESDNLKGGRLQAEHLIESGADKVLVVKGSSDYSSFNNRALGAEESLKAHKTGYDTLPYAHLEQMPDEARENFMLKFGGIICPNDVTACKVLKFLATRNIPVPGRVKVVGYDNLDFSEYVHPGLTTIEQPAYDLGSNAFDLLMALAAGEAVESRIMDVKLIRRQST
ncbi:LacI family DNA-binding transcriptional regulator [Salinicoccus carnicancri]|uniref:LacI family DNA-binding transcriptional regulator n=1 Tax=Salinicoccus carnicancri TaxID=558170 RepID=UPI00030888D2|nr:LacI family DNA-binding transcriptional regulator [Salinicoccus carnicancri]